MIDSFVYIISASLMFGMGILFGWVSKDRYPGNGSERENSIWLKAHKQGYRTGYNNGWKQGQEILLARLKELPDEVRRN